MGGAGRVAAAAVGIRAGGLGPGGFAARTNYACAHVGRIFNMSA